MESLTDSIERGAWKYLNTIDEMGGMVRAIERGFVQKEIQDTAYRYQREIEEDRRIIVGVNRFTTDEEPVKNVLSVDPRLRDVQIAKLESVKKERDQGAVTRALEALQSGAREQETNLLPLILDAVRSYASLGEICGTLRQEFGEHRESVFL